MIFSISIRKPKFKVFERVWERVNLFNLDRNAVVLVPNSAVMYPHILTWSKSKKWKESNFSYKFQDFPLLLQYCYSLQFPFRLAPFPLRLTLGKGGSQTVNKDDIILHLTLRQLTCDIEAIRVECSQINDVVVVRVFPLCRYLTVSHLA